MDSPTGTFGAHDRPEIDYPIEWTYRVVGMDEEKLRAAIAGVVGGAEHTVRPSKRSSAGKYLSLELVVLVLDEEQRAGVGDALHRHGDVKFVL